MSRLQALIPSSDWIRTYNRSMLGRDLGAGATVGVMLIPQAMAYALLAGVSPVYGLYASLVPLVVYAVLGTSRHLMVGIVAIDSLIVLAAVSRFETPGTPEYVAVVIVLAGLTGLIQLALGFLRFGFIVALLSRPVIGGFASGAAVTIGLSQLPGLLGAPFDGSPDVATLAVASFDLLSGTHLWSALVGVGSVWILALLRLRKSAIPGALLLLVLGIVLSVLVGLEAKGVEVVGTVPPGLPIPQFQIPAFALIRELFPLALTLALVQFTTLISLGKVFAAKHRYRIDANQELVALGAMNLVGSVFRSIPVSGSFSRSAVNEAAGAVSPASNLIAAALIGLTLLFLTPLFYHLPTPILAAVIMVAAFGMVDLRELRLLLTTKRVDGIIALITFGVTVFVGIQEGIVAGIAASVTAVMARITRPDVVELGHLPQTRLYAELSRRPEATRIKGLYILRIDASFSFVNAEFIRDHVLNHLGSTPDTRAILIDASSVNDLDTTAVEVLWDLADTLRHRGVRLVLSGVKSRVSDVADLSGLSEVLGSENLFLSNHRAVEGVRQRWEKEEADESSQSDGGPAK